MTGHVATAAVDIDAAAALVWRALTDPDLIQQYMFGAQVRTDWQPGSKITWTGEFNGKAYEDKGEVIAVEPERRLEVTHFSPLSGQPDVAENYHRLVYELESAGAGATRLSLSQDNNDSAEAAEHATQNWAAMLAGLKRVVEEG